MQSKTALHVSVKNNCEILLKNSTAAVEIMLLFSTIENNANGRKLCLKRKILPTCIRYSHNEERSMFNKGISITYM